MITAWKIAKARYALTAFDGEGARLNGARWNSVGTRVAYASESIALATLEVLVGLERTSLLTSYSLVSVRFDEATVEVLPVALLPGNWRVHPAPRETQAIGDRWVVEQRSLVLKVPSAVVDSEVNYLLNPVHPDFHAVTISAPEPYTFDARLMTAFRK